MPKRELPISIWLIAPIVIVVLPYLFRLVGEEVYYLHFVYGESGVIENLTVAFLVCGVVFGIKAIRESYQLHYVPLYRPWLYLLTFGSIFFAGEEISWGQHLLNWDTPPFWQSVNEQRETNLHNFSNLFDQVPRALLSLAAFVGGVLFPVFGRHVSWSKSSWSWAWPTFVCFPTCVLALMSSLPRKLAGIFEIDLPKVISVNGGETKECLLALFIMLYLASLYVRRNVEISYLERAYAREREEYRAHA